MEMLSLLWRRTSDQIVKNMKISLARRNSSNTIALQIIVKRFNTTKTPTFSELQFRIFSEPRGIWIEKGACVTERLDDEFGRGNLSGKFSAFFSRIGDTEFEERFDGEPSVLGFTAARFAPVIKKKKRKNSCSCQTEPKLKRKART